MTKQNVGPLTGVRVLELGSFIAGPFSAQLLGDYGAEVIKIEDPTHGDPMRRWGATIDGEGIWWTAIARNKRSVALDLRQAEARELVKEMAASSHVVVENFRPGRLDEWGLGYDALAARNPALVMVRISGYGQTGPLAPLAGFGSIGEAMGGIRHTTGFPDRPPTRTGISLGDATASLFAVIGALAALHHARSTGQGQVVDVAIYEAVAALMESTMAEHELTGATRTRTGSVLPGVAPSNVYPTADGSEILIAGNADTVFARLCEAMDRPDLITDPRYATHTARGTNAEALDEIIAAWTATIDSAQLLADLERAGVPAGRIYTAPDMLTDPHYLARDMVLRLRSHQGWDVPTAGIVPKFTGTPPVVRGPGPRLGADTVAVLRDVAGLTDEQLDRLLEAGLVRQDPATGDEPRPEPPSAATAP